MSKHILLVEDNEQDEILTLRALKRNQVHNEIHVARDGDEALRSLGLKCVEAATGEVQLPQIVLLDLKLPKMDGLEVLSEIRKNSRTKLLPVVILTTSNEDGDISQAYNLGANSYVRKPVDFDQFVDAVRQLGGYWLQINQYPSAGF